MASFVYSNFYLGKLNSVFFHFCFFISCSNFNLITKLGELKYFLEKKIVKANRIKEISKIKLQNILTINKFLFFKSKLNTKQNDEYKHKRKRNQTKNIYFFNRDQGGKHLTKLKSSCLNKD